MSEKLIISGLDRENYQRFVDLCSRVEAIIPEVARRGFDRSMVGRLAVNQLLASYEKSPQTLASALGFQAVQ